MQKRTIYPVVPFDSLGGADLVLDATYKGGAQKNLGADPLAKLLPVGNQGGFRFAGPPRLGACSYVVLFSSGVDPDWPDTIDLQTGRVCYYGDNKEPGCRLHETKRGGNEFLRQMFEALHANAAARQLVPPVFVFQKGPMGRDIVFRGMAAPGAEALMPMDDLVAVWKTKRGSRFQNYRATLTLLDCETVPRRWMSTLRPGASLGEGCPDAWRLWVERGVYHALESEPTISYRPKKQQLPRTESDRRLIQATHAYFRSRPHRFEECAAKLWQMAAPPGTTYDLTRPTRDGGRDAIGTFPIGPLSDPIRIDFALEAKCYALDNAVGVADVARLISRIRHRQFGVFVTTSFVGEQAYEEIRQDGHPVVIISSGDIAEILRNRQLGSLETAEAWLRQQFSIEGA